jgi:hypothetical protein
MTSRLAGLLHLLLVAAAVVTSAEPARAQSCGGSAGPSLAAGAATQGSWLDEGRGWVRLSDEYEVKDRSYKGSQRVANDFDESLFVNRAAVEVRYGLTDYWSADVTATYPHYTYRVMPPDEDRIKQRFRGPGDTFLSVGRRLTWDDPPSHEMSAMDPPRAQTTLSLWGGVSLPTGTPEKPDPAIVTRDVSVTNLQTGTGTFDPFFRARIERPIDRWTAFGEFDVLFPLYENRYRYRTADTETYVLGASRPVVSKLSASFSLMFQRVGRDEFRGENVGVGGSRTAYAVPGLAWKLTDAATLDVGVRAPFYRRTETKLSDSAAVFQIGLTYAF